MTIMAMAIVYWLGFLGGYRLGVTKRPNAPPPPVDVDEESMQAFERHMEGKIAMDRAKGPTAGVLH